MKNCNGCKHAVWKMTAAGRRHPSGDGNCAFPYKIPALPASMYWISDGPRPSGGWINRKVDLKEHCVYYSRAEGDA